MGNFNTKKSLILAGGILSIITGAACILGAILMISMQSYFLSIIQDLIAEEGMGGPSIDMSTLSQMLLPSAIVMIVDGLLSLIFGGLLIPIARKNTPEELDAVKGRLMVYSIICILLSGITSITGILLIVALFMKSNQTNTANSGTSNGTNATQSSNSNNYNDPVANEISKLRKLRDDGAITQEEYEKLIKNI